MTRALWKSSLPQSWEKGAQHFIPTSLDNSSSSEFSPLVASSFSSLSDEEPEPLSLSEELGRHKLFSDSGWKLSWDVDGWGKLLGLHSPDALSGWRREGLDLSPSPGSVSSFKAACNYDVCVFRRWVLHYPTINQSRLWGKYKDWIFVWIKRVSL